MHKLALAIMLAAPLPAAAQVPCIGVVDMMAALATGGFKAVSAGQIEGGTVTVYTHLDGRFFVIYADDKTACLVQDGTGWGAIKPNA